MSSAAGNGVRWTLSRAEMISGSDEGFRILDLGDGPHGGTVCVVQGYLVWRANDNQFVRLLDEQGIFNARLIQRAPEMAAVLKDLLAWNALLGEWDAPCLRRAGQITQEVAGPAAPPTASIDAASDILFGSDYADQGWNEETRLSQILDFLTGECNADPALAAGLTAHLDQARR